MDYELSEEDQIQVAAFRKWLDEGEYRELGDKTFFVTSKAGYRYALGEITALEYILSDPISKSEKSEESQDRIDPPVNENHDFMGKSFEYHGHRFATYRPYE